MRITHTPVSLGMIPGFLGQLSGPVQHNLSDQAAKVKGRVVNAMESGRSQAGNLVSRAQRIADDVFDPIKERVLDATEPVRSQAGDVASRAREIANDVFWSIKQAPPELLESMTDPFLATVRSGYGMRFARMLETMRITEDNQDLNIGDFGLPKTILANLLSTERPFFEKTLTAFSASEWRWGINEFFLGNAAANMYQFPEGVGPKGVFAISSETDGGFKLNPRIDKSLSLTYQASADQTPGTRHLVLSTLGHSACVCYWENGLGLVFGAQAGHMRLAATAMLVPENMIETLRKDLSNEQLKIPSIPYVRVGSDKLAHYLVMILNKGTPLPASVQQMASQARANPHFFTKENQKGDPYQMADYWLQGCLDDSGDPNLETVKLSNNTASF